MAQDLSIEDPEGVYFITTRTIGSRLWFVNNPMLEHYILSFLAKYQEKYGVILYGFILMGNHPHLIARFPNGNKADFLRSFNSMIARLVNSHVETFENGKLWARRARSQRLAENADVEHWMYYAALNPVSSGLTQKYSEYPFYNSFSDAIAGKARKFKLVDWTDFNNRKRKNKSLTPADCTKTHTLTYSRLPGYEHLSQNQYREHLLKKAEKRRCKLVEERLKEGKGFAGEKALLETKPGTKPRSTKIADRETKRPLVLTLCNKARKICLQIYFGILAAYKEASRRYRSGELAVQFPPGTYRAPLLSPP